MALLAGLTAAYARAIYSDGTKKFSEIRAEYVEAVKEYAAKNYSLEQINTALNSGWITQQQYDETLAYKVL